MTQWKIQILCLEENIITKRTTLAVHCKKKNNCSHSLKSVKTILVILIVSPFGGPQVSGKGLCWKDDNKAVTLREKQDHYKDYFESLV